MYYTFRFSTLVYVLKTEMALFTWILFYRTTFSFYRELMLCLWIINCCWKSTAALNYLCWREPVSDKKGTEHIAAAWEEKKIGGKKSDGRARYWFDSGKVWKRRHGSINIRSSNSLGSVSSLFLLWQLQFNVCDFQNDKKIFDKDQNQWCLVRIKEELLATKAKNLRKHISSDEADQVVWYSHGYFLCWESNRMSGEVVKSVKWNQDFYSWNAASEG